MKKKIDLKYAILAALFSALTAIGTFIRIPLPVSSFTLQFFFTCMSGVLLGCKYGAISQLLYVFLGLMGLPVFTLGGGFSYVFQPTFGFLLALAPSAYVSGLMVEKIGHSGFKIALACVAGLAVLYIVGLPYMHLILAVYMKTPWSIWHTLCDGMIIFLPGDAFKIFITAILCKKLYPILHKSQK